METLNEIFSDVCEAFEAELEEFNGEDDHVHLLIRYPPKTTISKLVNSLKGVSSRLIRKKITQKFKSLCGEKTYGLQVTLLVLVEEHLFHEYESILNVNRYLND